MPIEMLTSLLRVDLDGDAAVDHVFLLAAARDRDAVGVVAARDDDLVIDARDIRELAGDGAVCVGRLLGGHERHELGGGDSRERDIDAVERRRFVDRDRGRFNLEALRVVYDDAERRIVAARDQHHG